MNKLARQLYKFAWFFKNFRRINSKSLIVNGAEVTYNSDGLLTFNNSECLSESRFAKAYNKSLSVNDWRGIDGKYDMRWRYYFVCWLADHVKYLDGDFVLRVPHNWPNLALKRFPRLRRLRSTILQPHNRTADCG